jgi:hypothetical protein
MREQFSITKLVGRVVSAAFAAGIAYLAVRYALHPWEPSAGPFREFEHELAAGAAAVVFVVVLWRLARGTWGTEQADELVDIVDD